MKSSLKGWPDLPTRYESDLATDEQVRNIHLVVHSLPAVTYDLESLNLDMIIDVKRYSARLKLLRVTALVMKFVTQLKEKATEVNHRDTIVMDLREAESRWVKSIQRSSFAEEYQKLLSGESVIHKGQLILYLNDDFVICCIGHLNQSDLPSNMKNPIQLPTEHGFTELLVWSKHFAVHHDGTPATLAAVRENYWIVVADMMENHFLLLYYQIYLQNGSVQNHHLAIQVLILLDHCMFEVQGVPKIRYTSACLPVPPQGLFIWNLPGNCQPPYFY